jgi:hypothetical protein
LATRGITAVDAAGVAAAVGLADMNSITAKLGAAITKLGQVAIKGLMYTLTGLPLLLTAISDGLGLTTKLAERFRTSLSGASAAITSGVGFTLGAAGIIAFGAALYYGISALQK